MKSMFTTPEIEARRALSLQGYRIHDGVVWYITNDDTEQGIEEVRIGDAESLVEDTYWALLNAGWPTSGLVLCSFCKEAEASEIGGHCVACQRQIDSEDAADRWDRDRV